MLTICPATKTQPSLALSSVLSSVLRAKAFGAIVALLILQTCPVGAATLERIISREQKEMAVTGTQLGLGRDGHVFVINPGYMLRFNRDGSGKVGARTSCASMNATAYSPGFERMGLGGVGWPVGSIRSSEIVFRGKALGLTPQPSKNPCPPVAGCFPRRPGRMAALA